MTNPSSSADEHVIVLSGGDRVPAEFYETLQRQVAEAIPKLQFGREYKSQDLIDPLLWNLTDKGAHILMGRCVAHIVAKRKVALAFVGCRRCSNKRYVRV